MPAIDFRIGCVNGTGSAIFDKLEEFDSIRNDPDIVDLAKHWKNRNVRL